MPEELNFNETELLPAQDVTAVTVIGQKRLQLTFEDGASYPVDLSDLMRGPVFDEIFQRGLFEQVRVDARSGTITWPNGADLDPWVLRDLCEAQNK